LDRLIGDKMKKIYMIIIMILVVCGLFAVDNAIQNGDTFGNIRVILNDNFGELADTDTLHTAQIDTLFAEVDTLKARCEDATIFAYLTGHTQVLSDSSYTWVDGSFINSVVENFEAVADTTVGNYIQYTGTETITILVTGHMSVEVQFAEDVSFALKIGNGDWAIQAGSVITRSVNADEDVIAMGGSYMCEINQNDKIQIMIKTARSAGNTISNLNMSVALIRVK
jgi:UDP-2,3-diacylglucosamine pyrophosphatase LpxH